MTVEPAEANQPAYALKLSESERARYRFMAQRAVAIEADRWSHYGMVQGAHIADVGCGPGAVLVELARRAGDTGRVVGIEPDAQARSAAEDEIAGAGVANCTVVAGDAEHTALDAGSQDLVMVRHVLYHAGRRVAPILTHLASRIKPGGHLYVVDTDMTAARASFEDHDFIEQGDRYRGFQRGRGNNVDIGPRLGALLVDAGLELVEHEAVYQKVPGQFFALGGPIAAAEQEMVAAGAISAADAQRYADARRRLSTLPYAAMFIAQYIAVGRRPAAP